VIESCWRHTFFGTSDASRGENPALVLVLVVLRRPSVGQSGRRAGGARLPGREAPPARDMRVLALHGNRCAPRSRREGGSRAGSPIPGCPLVVVVINHAASPAPPSPVLLRVRSSRPLPTPPPFARVPQKPNGRDLRDAARVARRRAPPRRPGRGRHVRGRPRRPPPARRRRSPVENVVARRRQRRRRRRMGRDPRDAPRVLALERPVRRRRRVLPGRLRRRAPRGARGRIRSRIRIVGVRGVFRVVARVGRVVRGPGPRAWDGAPPRGEKK
jgi:hypothetical protein